MTHASKPNHSSAVEDYVKHIYKLTRHGERATTKQLAERMDLEQGTVSGMLRQLASRGLVEHEPYYGVTLTDDGYGLAMRQIRRHRLIELFLVKMLGFEWDEVDADAERLEHAVSDRLVERIDAALGYPQVDPHGAPIPSATGQIANLDYQTLAELAVGQGGAVRRVSDSEPTFLQHLSECEIGLGTALSVVAHEPFGAVRVRVGGREYQLPREAAQRIEVSPDSP